MEFDYSELIGKIIAKFGSRKNFAAAWGKSENIVSEKLNNKTRFTTTDIVEICSPELLGIPQEEISTYFFTPKVQ